MLSVPCGFCDRMHQGEYMEEIEAEIMACRDRVSALKRGDLDAQGDMESYVIPCTAEVRGGLTGTQDSAMADGG